MKADGTPDGEAVMTFEEIGEILGITSGGAWSLYKSGMKKLQRPCNAGKLQEMRDLMNSKES